MDAAGPAEVETLGGGATARVPLAQAQAMNARLTAFADMCADEERARAFGIDGVPFFAIDERYGISGAQPSALLLQALRQAWDERVVTPPEPADGCADGRCVR